MKRIPQSTIPSEGPTMGSRAPGHGQRLGWESLQPWSGKGAKEARGMGAICSFSWGRKMPTEVLSRLGSVLWGTESVYFGLVTQVDVSMTEVGGGE